MGFDCQKKGCLIVKKKRGATCPPQRILGRNGAGVMIVFAWRQTANPLQQTGDQESPNVSYVWPESASSRSWFLIPCTSSIPWCVLNRVNHLWQHHLEGSARSASPKNRTAHSRIRLYCIGQVERRPFSVFEPVCVAEKPRVYAAPIEKPNHELR